MNIREQNMNKINYLLNIADPHTHQVKIRLEFVTHDNQSQYLLSLPVWSPGSYLVREYSRHISQFKASDEKGRTIYFEQIKKNQWRLDLSHPDYCLSPKKIIVEYQVYCFEVGVRNSYIDDTHAFIHGPSIFMWVEGYQAYEHQLKLRFPPLWSKITTGLNSSQHAEFGYLAPNYDQLIDCPIEIGCHETDGFMFSQKAHHLAFYGQSSKSISELKADIKTIVETVAQTFASDLPYEHYHFITHFRPNLYGGLEHLNSTALHFDGRKFEDRPVYLDWLSLVAHEYFHTWNVKRIRPVELGPFDYHQENYTRMLWLAEGLTSFMDDLFVYWAKLCSETEYLEMIKGKFKTFFETPGRRFHSLSDSSFNAWIKLYRPDENSVNSTVSYYLKGGLVFMGLQILLTQNDLQLKDFIQLLWQDYKQNPKSGIDQKKFNQLLLNFAGKDIFEQFDTWINTTEDIDFNYLLSLAGIEFEWLEHKNSHLGIKWNYLGDRAVIAQVSLDTPAYLAGLSANDELLAINGERILRADIENLPKWLKVNQAYQFKIARLGQVMDFQVTPAIRPRELKSLKLIDKAKFERVFGAS
jgi:predicted metalloprotease with PDZ domain